MKTLHTEKEAGLKKKYTALSSVMNERLRRQWAACEALAIGYGGVACIARVTGLNCNTINSGIKELADPTFQADLRRVRRAGGGRSKLIDRDPTVLDDLQRVVESSTRGDPMSSLRWTTKSIAKLTEELRKEGHEISPKSVWTLMVKELGYTLQAPSKEEEGKQHPNRDKQFQTIAKTASDFLSRNQPALSVDAKKKELIGNYANSGIEWHPKGNPIRTQTHDFPDPDLGKVAPYGIYDIGANEGWVSVGISHDTAEFAVNSIDLWWQNMGRHRYPDAEEIYISADAGGSNGYRNRLWKTSLQQLADKLQLRIVVSHFPPGTSKWNKIEHRLFSEITKNWRGRPLLSYQVVVNSIANTTTTKGLKVKAALTAREYEKGIKIDADTFKSIDLHKNEFEGEWNYWIEPRRLS